MRNINHIIGCVWSKFKISSTLLIMLILVNQARIIKGGPDRPNIVLIIADDMGWDDVSFHGSDQVLTPNIDLLAYTGVALERYYSHCICTPTRSALLTGKYSYVTGMQGYPLTNGEDRGLPLNEKILPQYLKDLGYATHLVGKWHVGQSRTAFLPTMRGFDTHYGHRGGFIDYYEYTLQEPDSSNEDISGLGLFRNMTAAWDDSGYITDLYTDEAEAIIKSHNDSTPLFLTVAHNAPHSGNAAAVLQAPPEDVRSMRYVESPQRRIYAAMVKKLDESVGKIVNALLEKGILDNTVIAFMSDNGGMTTGDSMNYASNWPLRGLKMSPFEGGVRVNGLIWTQNLTEFSHLWKEYMHVTDWLPTLLKAAGGEAPLGLDGFDLWESITKNQKSDRKEMFEIDDITGYYSIILDDYKLVGGYVTVNHSDHQGSNLRRIIGRAPPYQQSLENSIMYDVLNKIEKPFNFEKTSLRDEIKVICNEVKHKAEHLCYPQYNMWCLYNIKEDPCEVQDLSSQNPLIVEKMITRLQKEMERVKPRKKIYTEILNRRPSYTIIHGIFGQTMWY